MLSEGFFHAFMMKGSRKVKNLREKGSRLFKGGFVWLSRVHVSVGTRCEEGKEDGDEGQELWNEEGEEVSVSLVSGRATKDMQRLKRSGNVRRVEPTSRYRARQPSGW
jgi:hypothetical protein